MYPKAKTVLTKIFSVKSGKRGILTYFYFKLLPSNTLITLSVLSKFKLLSDFLRNRMLCGNKLKFHARILLSERIGFQKIHIVSQNSLLCNANIYIVSYFYFI